MKSTNRRPFIVLAICAGWTLLLLLLGLRGFVPLQQAEFFARDWQARLGRRTPPDDRLLLIGIDKPVYEADFSAEELQAEPVLRELQTTFPWSRAVWARLIEKLAGAGAKVIVLDLVCTAPGDGDDALQQALEKFRRRVVIGYDISVGQTERGEFRELLLPNASLMATAAGQSPVEDGRLGYVTIWPDFDDTLRRVSFRQTAAQAGDVVAEGVVLESLEARVLRNFGRADAIPTDFQAHPFRFTAAPGAAYRPIPIGDVLSPRLWETNHASGKDFKDKIVLIGPTAGIFHDVHNTPFNAPGLMSGPEIHLQILNAALHGEFLREPSQLARCCLLALAGVVAGALAFLLQHPARRLLGVVGAGVGYAGVAQLLFDRAGMLVPLASPLMGLIASSLCVLGYDFVLERLERVKLRHTMGLYFSPRVLEAVLADPGSMAPRRAEVTLLLSDLRNSTPLAEMLGPQGMFDLLNRVFEAQTTAIMAEEGNLEHFLGDQFLSYWGAPQAQPDAAERAIRAALNLIAALERLRPTLSPAVREWFGYGVALHSGNVLVGNKGSAQRLDYGLIGDSVNEAARIEALTKVYGVRLLVSGVTAAQISKLGEHRLVDRVIVKGKTEPVDLFECENPCTPTAYAEICQRYQMAYAAYAQGSFASAQALFDLLLRETSDGPSRVLAARCADLAAQSPATWNGVWKMDAK